MTEDEAKTKICCGPPQVAAQMMRARPAYCAGSACMAWRWDKPIRKMRNMETGVERVVLGGEPYIPNVEQTFEEQNSNGYCGLASRS